MLKRLAHSASDSGTDGPAGASAVQHHAIAVAPASSIETLHSHRAARATTTTIAAAAFLVAIALLWIMHLRAIWPGFGFARVRAAQSGNSSFAVFLSLVACQMLFTGVAGAMVLASAALRHRVASRRGSGSGVSTRWSGASVVLLLLRVCCTMLSMWFALSAWSCRSSGVPLSAIDVGGGRSDEARTGLKQLSSSLAAAVDASFLSDLTMAFGVAALMLLVREESSSGVGSGGGSKRAAWFLPCTRALGSFETKMTAHPPWRSLGYCVLLLMLGWIGSTSSAAGGSAATACFESPLLTLGRMVTRASVSSADASAGPTIEAGRPFVDRRVWDLQFGSMDAFTSEQEQRMVRQQRVKLLAPLASSDRSSDSDSSAADDSLPNIVLFLTESVGASNLFPEGKWRPEMTPWIAEMVARASASAAESDREDSGAAGAAGASAAAPASAGGALAWSTIYSPFPATVRSHISLLTGGKTITSGSVWSELTLPYTAPTLVSALRSRGYRSAAFSAGYMNSENDDGYWRSLQFDHVNFPEDWLAPEKTRYETSSWGVDERRVAELALEWAETGLSSNVSAPPLAEGAEAYARKPWIIVFNTAATHHPYSVPADWIDPERSGGGDTGGDGIGSGAASTEESEATDAQRSQAAIRFIDSVLGQIITRLQSPSSPSSAAAGAPLAAAPGGSPVVPRRRTLVGLTGDHGEAFGAVHPGNFLHRNFLYEENVRSYFVLAQLPAPPPPLTAAATAGADAAASANAASSPAAGSILKPAQPLTAEARNRLLASLPPLVRHPGSNGQILATLLEAVDGISRSESLFAVAASSAAPASASSPSTAAASFASAGSSVGLPSSRLHYFYKLASPMQLGLRDGQFKFICPLQINVRKRDTTSSSSSPGGSSGSAGNSAGSSSVQTGIDAAPSLSELVSLSELYDLSADPLEHVNLAALHPARLARYRELAVVWYEDTQREFVSLLSDPARTIDPASALLAASFEAHSPSELAPDPDRVGPYKLDVGWLAFEDQFQLSPTDEVQLDTDLTIRALLAVADDSDRVYTYRFLSPQGVLHELPFTYEAGWRVVDVYPKATIEIEEGLWSVTLFHPEEGAVLSKAFWIVS